MLLPRSSRPAPRSAAGHREEVLPQIPKPRQSLALIRNSKAKEVEPSEDSAAFSMTVVSSGRVGCALFQNHRLTLLPLAGARVVSSGGVD